MPIAATNGAGRNIFTGMAVVYESGMARLVGPGKPATHLAATGSAAGGVVTLIDSGQLDLDNWGLVAGQRKLVANSPYYVGAGGKLTRVPSDQIAGISVGANSLQVQISIPQPSAASQTAATVQPTSSAFPSTPLKVITSVGPPTGAVGSAGDLCVDMTNKVVYGPKDQNGWGAGWPWVPMVAGTVALGNAVNGGTVSGLALTRTPVRAQAWVTIPVGGLRLTANVIGTSLTVAGFDYVLSAATDNANYKLEYLIQF